MESFDDLLQQGAKLLQQGNELRSLERAREALRRRPGNPLAENLLGLALFSQRRFNEAQEVFEGLVRRNPDVVALRVNAGLTALRNDADTRARAHFLRALTLKPDHRRALAYTALLHFKRGELDRARMRLDRAGMSELAARLEGDLDEESQPWLAMDLEAAAFDAVDGDPNEPCLAPHEGFCEVRSWGVVVTRSRAGLTPARSRPAAQPEAETEPKPETPAEPEAAAAPEAEAESRPEVAPEPDTQAEPDPTGGPAAAQDEDDGLEPEITRVPEADGEAPAGSRRRVNGPVWSGGTASHRVTGPQLPINRDPQRTTGPQLPVQPPPTELEPLETSGERRRGERRRARDQEPLDLRRIAPVNRGTGPAARLYRGVLMLRLGVLTDDGEPDELLVRQPRVMLHQGELSWEPAQRHRKGALQEPFLVDDDPMVRVIGDGFLVVYPAFGERLHLIALAKEGLYLRESHLCAFPNSLHWENGRIPGLGQESPKVIQLRGHGYVALHGPDVLHVVAVQEEFPLSLGLDYLVGWTGEVIPQRSTVASPLASGTQLLCSGTGLVLVGHPSTQPAESIWQVIG